MLVCRYTVCVAGAGGEQGGMMMRCDDRGLFDDDGLSSWCARALCFAASIAASKDDEDRKGAQHRFGLWGDRGEWAVKGRTKPARGNSLIVCHPVSF